MGAGVTVTAQHVKRGPNDKRQPVALSNWYRPIYYAENDDYLTQSGLGQPTNAPRWCAQHAQLGHWTGGAFTQDDTAADIMAEHDISGQLLAQPKVLVYNGETAANTTTYRATVTLNDDTQRTVDFTVPEGTRGPGVADDFGDPIFLTGQNKTKCERGASPWPGLLLVKSVDGMEFRGYPPVGNYDIGRIDVYEGVDCSGECDQFVQRFFEVKFGLTFEPDWWEHGLDWQNAHLPEGMTWTASTDKEMLRPGDGLVFAFEGTGAGHTGVIYDELTYANSNSPEGDLLGYFNFIPHFEIPAMGVTMLGFWRASDTNDLSIVADNPAVVLTPPPIVNQADTPYDLQWSPTVSPEFFVVEHTPNIVYVLESQPDIGIQFIYTAPPDEWYRTGKAQTPYTLPKKIVEDDNTDGSPSGYVDHGVLRVYHVAGGSLKHLGSSTWGSAWTPEGTVIAEQDISKAMAFLLDGREYCLAVTNSGDFKCFVTNKHFADKSWDEGTNVFTIDTGVDAEANPGGYAAHGVLYAFASKDADRICYKSVDYGKKWTEVV